MLSYRGLIDEASNVLYNVCDTPRIDAEYLMQHVINQSMAWLISHGDGAASAEHTHQFNQLIEQRSKGVPVAYLIGHRDFWTLRLKVNDHVLIPRGDTEILVEQALARLDATVSHKVLDLGTGSGAIALSIANERPNSYVTGIDQQQGAIDVAKANATDNRISNVDFIRSNWYAEVANQQFDLIASNPPYIEPGDPHLEQGDLRYEPTSALVAAEHGFEDLRAIIEGAPVRLVSGGWLLLEHGCQQAEEVASMLEGKGFNNISLYADLNHLPRCTAAQWGIES